MADYVLPDLPYDYGALEPHISGQIMELHHDKHHATYVTGAEHHARPAGRGPGQGLLRQSSTAWRRASRSTSAGTSTTRCSGRTCPPTVATSPTGDLGAAIDEFFGSFDEFRAHFTANANTIQGSGWSILVWDALGQRLNIVQLFDQQANLPLAQIPIVLLDMWEHAFYLQYKNVKADYVKAWWNVVNWADAPARFTAAVAQTPGLLTP